MGNEQGIPLKGGAGYNDNVTVYEEKVRGIRGMAPTPFESLVWQNCFLFSFVLCHPLCPPSCEACPVTDIHSRLHTIGGKAACDAHTSRARTAMMLALASEAERARSWCCVLN